MRQHFKHNLAIVSILVGVGLILGYFEGILFPQGLVYGVKIGISNIVVLFTLMYLGTKTAYLVAVLKSALSALLFMSLSALLYSLCGVLLSMLIMSALKKLLYPNRISVIGISVSGSAFFNIGQVIVACVYTKSFASMYLLTYMLPLSVITGVVTGTVTFLVLNRLKRRV